MARSDYRLCDVCDGKAFYDANLNYEQGPSEYLPDEPPYRVAGAAQYPETPEFNEKYGMRLDYVGDWAVLCTDCAKTHRTEIVEAARDADAAALTALRAECERLRTDNARLIEDRARFPDRPDDIGLMISAHYGNLKAAAKANEDAWRRAQATADRCATDSALLDWLLPKISGKEYRRIGVTYSEGADIRAAIDASRASGDGGMTG